MQVRRVKLPSDPLVSYWRLYREIANAVCPMYKELQGIECIWAKNYPSGVSSNAGTGMPLSLDEADRQELAKVLPKLPALRLPMSEAEAASFMEAYMNLASRPIWMPLLVTEAMILDRKIEHRRVMSLHIAAIRGEHRAGRLVPVGTNHVPLEAVQLGAHLTRKDAITYLERHGLAYDDGETAKRVEREVLSSEQTHRTSDSDQLTLSSRTSLVGRPILTDAKRAEAVKRHEELRNAGRKDYVAQTAKEYSVSRRSIYEWVKEDKEMKEKKRTMASFFHGVRKK